jgi:hypothetical protein
MHPQTSTQAYIYYCERSIQPAYVISTFNYSRTCARQKMWDITFS